MHTSFLLCRKCQYLSGKCIRITTVAQSSSRGKNELQEVVLQVTPITASGLL